MWPLRINSNYPVLRCPKCLNTISFQAINVIKNPTGTFPDRTNQQSTNDGIQFEWQCTQCGNQRYFDTETVSITRCFH
ncbi:MAG TPA: hypothetical protein PLZ08_05255 [Bacillota bacterium]|nr:hypothetical protein [Bacillota bacterium]HOL09804.1 hypothetical protein [Bacillota bacterium]HPO97350.1 hypothetical protein [Bacillota bacterium]